MDAENTRICSGCGKETKITDTFCRFCGTPYEVTHVQTESQNIQQLPTHQNTQPQQLIQAQQPIVYYASPELIAAVQENKKIPKWPFFLLGSIIVVAISLFLVITLYVNPANTVTDDYTKSAVEVEEEEDAEKKEDNTKKQDENKNTITEEEHYDYLITGRWKLNFVSENDEVTDVSGKVTSYAVFEDNHTGYIVLDGEYLNFDWRFYECEDELTLFFLKSPDDEILCASFTTDKSDPMYNYLLIVPFDDPEGFSMGFKRVS